MTSRDFNGTTSVITADNVAFGAKTVGPWSAAVHAIWDGAGEGSLGHFFQADTNAFRFRLESASTIIGVRQLSSVTSASIITDALFTTGVWYCLIATFDGTNCHLWYGTAGGPMKEATYSTNTAMTGSFTNWATPVNVGNNAGGSATFDGRLLHPAVVDWVMDYNEMERYRVGNMPVLFARGLPRLYFTCQDANAGIDASRRNQNVSTTGITVSQEMPPGVAFDWDWARDHPLHRAVAATTQTVAMNFVTNTPTVFSPTVTPGSVSPVLPLITNTPTVFSPAVIFPLNETFPGASGAPESWWTTSVVGTGTIALDTNRLKSVVPALNDVSRALFTDVIPADSELYASITYTVGTNQSVAFNFRGDGTWVATAGGAHLPQNGLTLAPSVLGDQVKLFTTVASVTTQVGSTYSLTIGATDTVNLRVSMTGTAVSWKAWIAGSLQPTEWQTGTDSNHSARKRLSLAVLNPTSSTATLYWDDITAGSKSVSQNVVLPLVTNTPTVFSPLVTLSSAPITETWTGTNGDPWPAQWTTGASGTGALADIQSNKGRMRTGTVAFGKVYARNTAAYGTANYSIAVDITIPTVTEWFFYVHLRGASGVVNSHTLASSYQIRFALITGVLYAQLYEVDASGTETFRVSMGPVSGTPGAGDTVRIGIEVSGTSSITLHQKAYKVGTSDPGFTDLSASVATAYTGSYFLLSVQGGTDALTDDFLWDDFAAIALAQIVVLPLVTSTPTVFDPTVTPGALTVAMDLVTNTPTVFSPSVLATQTVQLPRVNNVPVVFTPAIQQTQYPVLPLVVNIVNVFNPTVSTGAATVVAPLVTNTPTVFSPAVSNATQVVSVPMVYATSSDIILDENHLPILDSNGLPLRDGTSGVFAPALIFYSISVPLVDNTPVVFAPTVIGSNVTVVMDLVTSPQTVFAPTTSALVAMDLVDSTPTVFSPSVRGTQTTVLPLVTNVPTVFAPSIAVTQTVTLPLVTSPQTIFPITVQQVLFPVLPLVTNTPVVFSPAVLTTSVIVMERVINTPVVFDPSVAGGAAGVEMQLVLNRPTVFTPAIRYGVYTFIPPHDERGPRKLSEYGRRRAGVSRVANNLAGRYGAPQSYSVLKIDGVYRQIQGPTTEQITAATEYYAGGHIHEVGVAQAAALEAAGFDVEGY